MRRWERRELPSSQLEGSFRVHAPENTTNSPVENQGLGKDGDKGSRPIFHLAFNLAGRAAGAPRGEPRRRIGLPGEGVQVLHRRVDHDDAAAGQAARRPARRQAQAPSVKADRYDLVIDPSNL